MIDVIETNKILEFTYLNHENKTEKRKVRFNHLEYGSTEYYPEPQFLLFCFCFDRKAFRSFAVKNISNLEIIWF